MPQKPRESTKGASLLNRRLHESDLHRLKGREAQIRGAIRILRNNLEQDVPWPGSVELDQYTT